MNVKGKPGFGKIFAYGKTDGYNFIAMELLGPSLKSLFAANKKPFTLQTVL